MGKPLSGKLFCIGTGLIIYWSNIVSEIYVVFLHHQIITDYMHDVGGKSQTINSQTQS